MYIGNWPYEHARIFPDSTACIDTVSNIRYSWAEFSHECDLIADYLFREKKINHGDRIAVISENSPTSLSVFFACMQIGAVYVPINPNWPDKIVENIIIQTRPRLIFNDEFYKGSGENLIHFLSYSLLSDTLSLNGYKKHITEVSMSMQDPAVVVFLPETEPLGITIPQSLIYNNSITTILAYGLFRNDNVLASLNFSSPAGLFIRLLPVMMAGGSAVFFRNKDNHIQNPQINSSQNVYLEPQNLKNYKPETFETIRVVFPWGGIKKTNNYLNEFKNLDFDYRQEIMFPCAGMNCFLLPEGDFSKNVLGLPLYGVQAKIGDSQDGHELNEGEIGELFFRGTSLFSGIWNSPKATADFFLKGWLRTRMSAYHKNGIYYAVI